jgi:hypothetical protein
MSLLQGFSLGWRNVVAEFAGDGSSEEAATHPDATMNAPTIDSHSCLCKGSLPRKDVCIDGIDETSVKIKN